MNCLICQHAAEYFLTKTYTEAPFNEYIADIGPVYYYKCVNCGFTMSKTHAELGSARWSKLNWDVHAFMEDPDTEKKGNQPPYLDQAAMINLLAANNIISSTDMVDYAAGYGTLSHILEKYYHIRLPVFDEYVTDGDLSRYIKKEDLKQYKTVINSAMFEHVLTREDLDKVNELVAPGGSLIIHTVICENIPADPDWFYFRPPVHTAFHTNKSMGILMEQWNYKASLYCPAAKCWILLKTPAEGLFAKIAEINRELQTTYLHYQNGFVDFWKGF